MVVLSRDAPIPVRGRLLVAPCNSTIRGIPTEVVLEPGEDPVPKPSAVALDSLQEVGLGQLTHFMGRLHPERMRQICEALKVAVDCP